MQCKEDRNYQKSIDATYLDLRKDPSLRFLDESDLGIIILLLLFDVLFIEGLGDAVGNRAVFGYRRQDGLTASDHIAIVV